MAIRHTFNQINIHTNLGNGGIHFIKEESIIVTYSNLFTNSNFVNTTGWTGATATLSAASNILSVTGSGTGPLPRVYQTPVAYVNGKKIYVKVRCTVTNASCIEIYINASATGMVTLKHSIKLTPVNGTEYSTAGIITLGAGGSGNVSLIIVNSYVDAATANGKVMQLQEALAVDLTAAGYADKDVAWCEANLPWKL